MIGANLLRFNKEQKYLIWDKETTGLNLVHSLPWEVSFMVCTVDQVLEEHDYFVWWNDFKISRGAAAVTRFDYNEYKAKAQDSRKILDIFESYIYNDEYIPLGHNVLGYDTMIHQAWRRKLGLKPNYSYLGKTIDTNCLGKALKKRITPDLSSRENFQAFQYRMHTLVEKGLKTNLPQMGKDFNIEFDYDSVHRGINDIRLNRLVWNQLMWKIEV